MLTIETDNPDIDVKELSQRVDEKVKRIKKSSSPFKRIVFSVHDKYDKTEKPYLVAQKDAYHINELLCFQGNHFIVNAYRAIIQEKADPKVIEQYNLLFSQGILNKKEILCKLRYSPEGRKKNILIQGLRSLRFAQQAFGIPIVGTCFRIVVCILRLPVLFRNIQRLDNMVIVCQEELQTKVSADDYLYNLKRISVAFQMS